MNRLSFLGRMMAALGVGVAAGTGLSASLSTTAPPPPAPPCPRCGGTGLIVAETLHYKSVISLAEGTGLPIPYGALYESRTCPRCIRFA